MNKSEKKKKSFSLKDIILTTIFTIFFIVQIILMFLFFNELSLIVLVYIGCVIWVFSIYFGMISFWTFKKRGKVEKGKMEVITVFQFQNEKVDSLNHLSKK